jgi:hypothetical protein
MIEDQIGAPVKAFCYPYAFPETDQKCARRLKDILVKGGYKNGVTTIIGTPNSRSHRFFLPRLPVKTWDDPRFFQAKLEGGYNWFHSFHSFQSASKLVLPKVS